MKLKAKSLKLVAGRPVAIMHSKTADALNVHVDDRVVIHDSAKKITAVVDIAMLDRKDEIILSEEILRALKIKEGHEVEIIPARRPIATIYIKKKLDGCCLNDNEIEEIIKGIVENKLTEPEIAYFVSSIYKNGMSIEETVSLTKAIVSHGKKLGIKSRIIADKHGIGGIAGNRTTPIVVSICVSAGLIMPKTSSRAITSAGGTADVIETVADVEFSIEEMKKIVSKTGACMIWGGSLGLAPADDKIIQVERLLHLDPQSQLIASILAKKISVGATHVVLDIPYGKYAKVSKQEAIELERKFKEVANHFKIKLRTVLAREEQPVGNSVGPALEMMDVIEILQQKKSRALDLEKRSVMLAGYLLEMTGNAKKGNGEKIAGAILKSGKAYKKFLEIIKAQHGDIKRLKFAKLSHHIFSKKSGAVKEINGKDLMALARTAGAPSDKSAGVYLYKHLNDKISVGEKIITIYAESNEKMKNALELYNLLLPVKIK